MTTAHADPIIAFRTGPPYHKPGILCLDCGAPGFDQPLKRYEVKQVKCDWCGDSKYSPTLEVIFQHLVEKIARQERRPLTEDEKGECEYLDGAEIDPFTGQRYETESQIRDWEEEERRRTHPDL